MLNLTLRFGVSQYSADAFALYGFMLAVFLGDTRGGREFALLSIALVKKHHFRAADARVHFVSHALVVHWSYPAHMSLKPLLYTYDTGMATGDIESGIWGIYAFLLLANFIGKPLPDIAADLRSYGEQAAELKQAKMYGYMRTHLQYALNLMGESENTSTLTGEALNEGEAWASFEPILQDSARSLKIRAADYFGEF